MDEEFELPIEFKGQEHIFKSTLLVYGYTHKFQVNVNGRNILFEPDEEKNYRAVLNYGESDTNKIDVELIKEIASTIQNIFR